MAQFTLGLIIKKTESSKGTACNCKIDEVVSFVSNSVLSIHFAAGDLS